MACHNNIAAFRCRNCGHLEDAGHAGENLLPHACSVCDAGVVHSPKLKALADKLGDASLTKKARLAIIEEIKGLREDVKDLDPSNWEVLADCTEARLHELNLHKDKICKHTPEVITTPRFGQIIKRETVSEARTKDNA